VTTDVAEVTTNSTFWERRQK